MLRIHSIGEIIPGVDRSLPEVPNEVRHGNAGNGRHRGSGGTYHVARRADTPMGFATGCHSFRIAHPDGSMRKESNEIDPEWLRSMRDAMASGNAAEAEASLLRGFGQVRNDGVRLAELGRHMLRMGRGRMALYLFHRAVALEPGDADILQDLGRARLEAKDPASAMVCFEAILAGRPSHGPANHGLGWCLWQSGDRPGAAAAFTRALAGQPDSLPLLLDFARLSREAGDARTAERCFADIERLAPEDPAYWLAYGSFLCEQGRAAEALQWIDRYGRQHSDDATARLEKARCLRALGQVEQAMRWLELLEARQPGIPENSEEYGYCLADPDQAGLRVAHWSRAIALWTAAGAFAKAAALADRLLAGCPQSAIGWDALARLEYAREHWDAAETAWRKALEHDPTLLDAAAGLAHYYEDTNRGDEAAAVARIGLNHVGPGQRPSGAIELHLALSKAARRSRDPDAGLTHLAAAEAIAISDSQREHVAFEHGRLLELKSDTDKAFAAFELGNDLSLAEWQRTHPGPNRYLAGVEAMLERVRGGCLRTWNSIDAPGLPAAPAFLIGFPRSGTSLLNQVLDGHSRIQALEEKPPAQKMLEAVRNMPGGYPDAMAGFDAIDLGFLRDAYFRSAAEHGAGDRSKLLFDKFPLHINIAGLLHRVFPGARFVFSLRHPCDVVLSCFMQQFRLNHAMTNFCTLEGAVTLYTRTMDLWEIVRTQLPLSVHDVRYEDVVADFDGQVQALCDFLQVSWEEGLRHFAARARDRGRIDTPSYAQVSRPIYREAVYRWERYRRQLAPWLPVLQPYIERFGYA
ncbi:MAG TPA: sulfotransferase [Xanthomonadaceae bacterium]|jgi:tetratricopeptide (TPR) repeat protein